MYECRLCNAHRSFSTSCNRCSARRMYSSVDPLFCRERATGCHDPLSPDVALASSLLTLLSKRSLSGRTRPLAPLPSRTRRLHTGAVDVADLELCGLRNSQPAAIDRHQEHAVAWLSGRSQDRFDLAARVDFRAPGGALHVRD